MAVSRITRDPAKMGGVPCIRGLCISVATVLYMLGEDLDWQAVLEAYPDLERADLLAALQYAACHVGIPRSGPDPTR